MKKTTVTESFDENGKIVKRVTVTEDDYTPYYPSALGWKDWPVYRSIAYNTNGT